MNKNQITGLLAGLLCSLHAAADTTLEYSTSANSQQPGAIYLTADKLRADNEGERTWVLYDRSANTLFIVDDDEGKFFVIDEAQVKALGQTIGNVNQQLEDALSSLPPEQRAQARAMMQSMLPGGGGASSADDSEAIEARFTGRKDEVAGIRCEIVETMLANQVESEMCIADPDALKLSAAETATLESMAEFAQTVLDEIKTNAGNLLPANFSGGSIVKVLESGVPVRMVDSQNNDSATLESVSHADIDAELMRIPASYQRDSFGIGQ